MEKELFSVVCTVNHFYVTSCSDEGSSDVPALRIERRTGQVSEGPRKLGGGKVEAFYKCEALLGEFWFARRRYLLIVASSKVAVQNAVFGTVYEITGVIAIPYDNYASGALPKGMEDVLDLLKFGFYYSSDTDLTNSMQAKRNGKSRNTKYLWNEECLKPFFSAGYVSQERWFAFVIQGSVEAASVKANEELRTPAVSSVLIARKSKRRAGTRYSVRGIGDDGEILEEYGDVLYCNLLTDSKKIEKDLSSAFETQVKKHNASYTAFDFYANLGNNVLDGLKGLYDHLEPQARDFGFTGSNQGQKGVIRTNCMDCLDRTNVAQFIVAWFVFLRIISKAFPAIQAFEQEGEPKEKEQPSWFASVFGSEEQTGDSLLSMMRELWANMGDRLSTLSTGTSSILSGQLRNKSEAFNVFDTVRRTVERSYNANFEDSNKNQAYLALINGGHMSRSSVMKRGRVPCGALRIWIGTWNLGGKSTINAETIVKWINNSQKSTDVYCFCFQEAISLTAQNVFLKTRGDEDVVATIDSYCRTALGDDFVKLRGAGMVGIYNVVFVRIEDMCDVSQVRVRRFRLGTFGGNKGGTSVEFTLKSTDVSFVNVHLEAGKFKHEDRIFQLDTILKAVECDLLVLGGDYNFRLDLNDEEAHEMLQWGADLRKHDQYLATSGLGLEEYPIVFKPTYKFIPGTLRYDITRGPAWCDRILWRGHAKASHYCSHEAILASDHLPVSLFLETALLTGAAPIVSQRLVNLLSADGSTVLTPPVPIVQPRGDLVTMGSASFAVDPLGVEMANVPRESSGSIHDDLIDM
eukprot:GEMP01013343.1.p1 GENE.GEMP01013343.1~~GEMP01013343.1.p1  ORF type:complete len:804 (+),score=134.05 GEMP01013343.1:75-2486(+)